MHRWKSRDKMEKEHIKKIGLIVVGIILALIILELGLRLGGFVIMSMQRAGNKVSNDQEESYRILGLGESTTAEIYTEESSWPSQLKIVLNERNPELKFEVFNEGVPSVSTDFILSVLEDELLDKYKPDMIIIMTGINDELAQCFQCNNITPSNKILSFFRNFRIYKLSRLIYLHLENKIRNTRAKGINLSKMDYERYDKNMIKRIINKKPTNDEEYVELGAAYKSIGYIKEASEAFAKAIEVNPENYYAYVELGNYYKGMREFDRAEKMFKKAIEMNPEKTYAYIELAYFYETQDRMDEAREVYQQAIEVNPESYDALIAFAVYYMEQNKSKEAEDILKRAIEVKENNYDAYVEVGRLYNVLGKYKEAEEILKKAIEMNPEKTYKSIKSAYQNLNAYFDLAIYYLQQDKIEEAEEMFKKAYETTTDYYSPTTVKYYLRLYTILEERNIRLVAMQYPMRDINNLKRMFSEEQQKNIIFVSNEENFKEALRNSSYDDIFVDRFAGDFGHATLKGNRLIAENVADAVLGELKIS